MKALERTPLESWIAEKIGAGEGRRLTREAIARYQLEKINETIEYASRNSPFYKRLLSGNFSGPLSALSDLARLPFTTADDIRSDPFRFLCVSRDQVARVVTLQTSGTTNNPKRLFFTDSDLESTVDFFHRGMSTLVRPGRRVLVLMPGELPGSVGDLLVKGLARMNVAGFLHGPVRNVSDALDEIVAGKIDCIVGIPAQVASLARSSRGSIIGRERIESVLLSADYVPKAVVAAIGKEWQCKVFQHYGMTETGLGGGVECAALDGYHMREADLCCEIVDPESGTPLPPGEIGEVAFTTLTREGMPLIRYRTGDLASFVPAPCPCGTVLERMSPVMGRVSEKMADEKSFGISVPDLDEAVFAVPGVMNYRAEIHDEKNRACLKIKVFTDAENVAIVLDKVREALLAIPGIRNAGLGRTLTVEGTEYGKLGTPTTGAAKRQIMRKGATKP